MGSACLAARGRTHEIQGTRGRFAGESSRETRSTQRTAREGAMPAQMTIEKMDSMTLIINDHRTVDDLFQQFEKAKEPELKLRLVSKMIEELSVHASIEERELYPILREKLDNGEELYQECIQEHQEAKAVLSRLEKLSATRNEFDKAVKELIEDVRHHIEEEESNVLPKLQEKMSENELLQLGRRLRQAKSTAPMQPVMDVGTTATGQASGQDLAGKSTHELYEMAKELSIEGRSKMNHDQLVKAIQQQG